MTQVRSSAKRQQAFDAPRQDLRSSGLPAQVLQLSNPPQAAVADQPDACAIAFTAGTRIATLKGYIDVAALCPGDLVLTADHGYQPVRWVGRQSVTAAQWRAQPNLCPLRLRRGAIAPDLPERDMLVAPQHRILIKSPISARMFASDEVLVAAKHLTAIDGIAPAEDVAAVTYVYFLCDQHEVVFAEGIGAESLFTGKEALRALSTSARQALFAQFPKLRDQGAEAGPTPARPLVPGRRSRKLAKRHSANHKPLQMPDDTDAALGQIKAAAIE